MKISHERQLATVRFIISDPDPAHYQAMHDLAFAKDDDRFILTYSANTPHLDRIYENFARSVEQMILQTALVQPVDWESAIATFLQRIEGHAIDWYLVGSAALAVRGIDVRPRDIDTVVADADAVRLGEIVHDYLIQPVQEEDNWIAHWFGRAFIGARIEWIGGVNEYADQPVVSDFGTVAATMLETITWRGYHLRVPPLHLQLATSERRGLHDRVTKIKQAMP